MEMGVVKESEVSNKKKDVRTENHSKDIFLVGEIIGIETRIAHKGRFSFVS